MSKPRILLLQGPVGGFFKYLQGHLRDAGFEVKRLVFNGGDILFALGSDYEVAHPGEGGFPAYFDRLIGDWRPDAVVLFGDERPIHRAARQSAKAAGIPVWSFEEGYIRPDHVTFELGGNNANSTIRQTFDPTVFPPPPPSAPRLTGQTTAMGLRAWAYFVAHRSTRNHFEGYTHHRERRLRDEFRFWIKSAHRRTIAHRHDQKLIERILSGLHPPFFMVALQVHDDLQLRCHGRGWKTMNFAEMVFESFRRTAPPNARLVVKAHPLDVGHGHHRKNIRLLIAKYGLEDRVEYLQSGPLLPIVRHSRGLVTINSTAGIAALRNHIPVIAFGDALYHVPGLSRRPEGTADLDRFWNEQPQIDVQVAWRFGEHVLNSVLIPGSFYLQETWKRIADVVVRRLGPAPSPAPEVVASGTDAAATDRAQVDTTATKDTAPVVPTVDRGGAGLQIGIMSGGIWKNRGIVETLIGGSTTRFQFLPPRSCDLVVGWGHKATSAAARRVARSGGLPYVALEDGFLRSVRPGADEAAVGWIVDRRGIYYDSHSASDLEAAIMRRAARPADDLDRVRSAMKAIRDLRLSKYNHAPMLGAAALGLPQGRDIVLVVDQTFGDASISGAGADGASFVRMLDAAIAENPGIPVVVKVHPEAIGGAKRGYLAAVARLRGVYVVADDVNPWSLIEMARRVYVVSSQFGLEALLADVPVTCFGASAYAGWGLTDDRIVPIRRRVGSVTREGIAGAAYLDYCRWIDPYHGTEIDFESAIDRLAFLRDRFHENRTSVCVGFSKWKRRAAEDFLTGIGRPRFVDDETKAKLLADEEGARIVVWGRRGFTDREAHGRELVRVEDGFLRSVGLGAAFVAPASLVFDAEGIYYDPRRRSGFETIAETAVFDERILARARALRAAIVERRLSKYNDDSDGAIHVPTGRTRILVPGQVEDDASVDFGSPVVRTNLDLLRRVRERWPDAHIVFKPHPDVQAGYRKGRVSDRDAATLADQIVLGGSMPRLLEQIDRVETMTSLTGFEALLRGIPVTCHGLPFYSGWGLTEDMLPGERRSRALTLDELVAAALILYPRYVDPVTRLPCPVEVVVERLGDQVEAGSDLAGRLRRQVRHAYAWTAHNVLGPLFRRLTR